jgi:hypothetical protein
MSGTVTVIGNEQRVTETEEVGIVGSRGTETGIAVKIEKI